MPKNNFAVVLFKKKRRDGKKEFDTFFTSFGYLNNDNVIEEPKRMSVHIKDECKRSDFADFEDADYPMLLKDMKEGVNYFISYDKDKETGIPKVNEKTGKKYRVMVITSLTGVTTEKFEIPSISLEDVYNEDE